MPLSPSEWNQADEMTILQESVEQFLSENSPDAYSPGEIREELGSEIDLGDEFAESVAEGIYVSRVRDAAQQLVQQGKAEVREQEEGDMNIDYYRVTE